MPRRGHLSHILVFPNDLSEQCHQIRSIHFPTFSEVTQLGGSRKIIYPFLAPGIMEVNVLMCARSEVLARNPLCSHISFDHVHHRPGYYNRCS